MQRRRSRTFNALPERLSTTPSKSLGRMNPINQDRKRVASRLSMSFEQGLPPGNSEEKKKPTGPVVMEGTCAELTEMLVLPHLSGSAFRDEFFYALRYIDCPKVILDKICKKVEDAVMKDDWLKVLLFWVENHFYYFSASNELMSSLVNHIAKSSLISPKVQEVLSVKT